MKHSWIGNVNVKMDLLHKVIYGFTTVPLKLPMETVQNKNNKSCIHFELQKKLRSNTLKKKKKRTKMKAIILPELDLLNVVIIKTDWCCNKEAHRTIQQN